MEQPPLDAGGRFKGKLQRATVTLQESALFNTLSRRIVGQIWEELNDELWTQGKLLVGDTALSGHRAAVDARSGQRSGFASLFLL